MTIHLHYIKQMDYINIKDIIQLQCMYYYSYKYLLDYYIMELPILLKHTYLQNIWKIYYLNYYSYHLKWLQSYHILQFVLFLYLL